MSTLTKNLAIVSAPVPERLAATIASREALYALIAADNDALGPFNLAVVRGAPPEEQADLLFASARHSDLRTRALALFQAARPILDGAETTAARESGDEIIETLRPMFTDLVGQLSEVVYVLGPDPDGELASRTAAGAAAWSTYQEIRPRLEAVRRVRAALAAVSWGHPHPLMAAWIAPDCIHTRGDWATVEDIGDRALGRLLTAGATVQLNTRAETAELLAKVAAFPPDAPPLTPADAVANRRADAELKAIEATIAKARAVRVQ